LEINDIKPKEVNMNINNETFEQILWGDHEDFEAVTGTTKIENQSRWSIYKSCVYKQNSTGKFFEAYWGEGATEMQEDQSEHWHFAEVEPKEVNTIVYSYVKGGQKFEGNT
jgi:hypothetical protein